MNLLRVLLFCELRDCVMPEKYPKRRPFYWKELSKFGNDHSSIQLLQTTKRTNEDMPDEPEESEYSEYEDEEEGDDIEESEAADKPKVLTLKWPTIPTFVDQWRSQTGSARTSRRTRVERGR